MKGSGISSACIFSNARVTATVNRHGQPHRPLFQESTESTYPQIGDLCDRVSLRVRPCEILSRKRQTGRTVHPTMPGLYSTALLEVGLV